MVKRERGLTVLEAVVSAGMLLTVTGALLAVGAGSSRTLGEAFRETAAARAASARLEALAAGRAGARIGTHAFPPDPEIARPLPGAEGEEEVRQAGPGLLSVEVRILWKGPGGDGRRLAVATLVAGEAAR